MNKHVPILIGILLMIAAVWTLISPTPNIQQIMLSLDNLGYDFQLRTRTLTQHSVPTPIAIIDIDDKSLTTEGRWPWPRSKLAELVNQLQKYGAAVIAFDVFFAEKEENIAQNLIKQLDKNKLFNAQVVNFLNQHTTLFDEDKVLADSFSRASSVLAFSFLPHPQQSNNLTPPLFILSKAAQQQLQIFKMQGYISDIPLLQQAAKGSGFINIFPDADGIIRRASLILEYQGGIYPSLALDAVLVFLSENISLITPYYGATEQLEGIKVGPNVIPTDASGQVLIPFIGHSFTFPYYSATDVLHGRIPKDALSGKILFVGASATGIGDLKATSVQSPFPGVEIQATLANGILLNQFSYKPAWILGANIVLTIFFGLFAALIFPHLGPKPLTLTIIILPPGLLVLNNLIWKQTGLIISLLIPIILISVLAIFNLIYGYLFETRRREKLKAMFGQYVPAKHIDQMLKTSSNYALGGEDRNMSVLFADIRDFTAISENLSAAELVDMLNTIFTPLTEIIFKYRGTIDKYIGDLIMAFWGAPLRDKNHSRHALHAALEMQAKITELQPEFTKRAWPEIKIGIGINSGIMSVGDMGSRFRRNYTVLGDAVNLASRIEGLTKYYDANIIVTESTQKNHPRFIFRKLDRVKVKGKLTSIDIYELICLHSQLKRELEHELKRYHQALNYYFEQQWEMALLIFQQLATEFPKTKIYRIYIHRVNEFRKHPVPANWDGVYVHTAK